MFCFYFLAGDYGTVDIALD